MPIYEYRCQACGFQKEYLQKMSDTPLTDCPECGKPTLAKMVTAAGFQLKGSGWYATDFKSSGAKPAAKANGEAKANGGEAKAEAKSEAKSEPKSEASSTSSSSSGGRGSGCACH